MQTDGGIYHVLGLQESILCKWLYYPKNLQIQYNACQIPNGIFHRIRAPLFTICMLTQNNESNQSNIKKEKQSQRIRFPDFRHYWVGQKVNYVRCYRKIQMNFLANSMQSYSNQDGMVLAQKQKHRLMEQAREPTDKLTHLRSPSLWQRRQEYTLKERQSHQ